MLYILLQSLESEEDKNIFTEIYLANEQFAFKTANYLLKNKANCADCVQEIFLELIKSFESYKALDSERQKKYYLTVCRRCAYKMNAENTDVISIENLPEDILSNEPDLSSIKLGTIVKIINSLDDNYRIPLSMKYAEGKSIKEIAGFLSVSQNTVKQRLFRGRKMIFKALEGERTE